MVLSLSLECIDIGAALAKRLASEFSHIFQGVCVREGTG